MGKALWAILVGGMLAYSADNAPKTLGGFKRQFLNQKVVIRRAYQLELAQQSDDGSYEPIFLSHIPARYQGQIGTVVAVQVHSPSQHMSQREPNAFGENVEEDRISDPLMDVVVRFADNAVGVAANVSASSVDLSIELASKAEASKNQIETKLPSLVGRKAYAFASSHLYKITTTVEQMAEEQLYGNEDPSARFFVDSSLFFKPLTIVEAKYLADENAVIMKLSLPDHTEAIAYANAELIRPGKPLISEIISLGYLFPSFPTELTPKEIQAIKEVALIRGMSWDAVSYEIGFQDSENDWGRGGKQRVYFHGKLLIYFDRFNKVQDWQRFE